MTGEVTKKIDRRRNGVYTAKISDDNGGHDERLIINVRKWKGYMTFALVLIAFGTGVAGIVRVGVQHEVEVAVEKELKPPEGQIVLKIDAITEAHGAAVLLALDQRFDALEKNMVAIQTQLADHFENDTSRHKALKDELHAISAELRRN